MWWDTSVTKQTYIDDCEVCCMPNEVMAQFSGDEVVAFDPLDIGQYAVALFVIK